MSNRLKDLRKAKGLTQRAVADRAGLSQPHYNGLENGRKRLNQETLEALANALDVSPVDILSHEDQPDHQKLVMLFAQMTETKRNLLLQIAEEFARPDKTT